MCGTSRASWSRAVTRSRCGPSPATASPVATSSTTCPSGGCPPRSPRDRRERSAASPFELSLVFAAGSVPPSWAYKPAGARRIREINSALRNAGVNKRIQPHYPEAAIRGRVQGTVYLALRVNRSGHVVEAVAEQVNLGNTGSDRILKQYREILAESALKAARQWSYAIPTTSPLARQDSWTAHVPVNYALNVLGAPEPDRTWVSYVPGPYTPAPWVDKPDMNAADALADDAVRTEGAGPTLLTPFNHG